MGSGGKVPNTRLRAGIVFSSQALDGVTFALAVSMLGISGEANPVASMIYGMGGIGLIMLVKIAAGFMASMIVFKVNVGRWWIPVAWIGVFGASTNVVSVL